MAPRPGRAAGVGTSREAERAEPHWGLRELRAAVAGKDRHRDIPKVIATWPLDTLRLSNNTGEY